MPIRRISEDSLVAEAVAIEKVEALTRPLPTDTFTLMGAVADKDAYQIGHAAVAGIKPAEVPTQDMLRLVKICDNGDDIEKRYRDRIRSPLTAIRAWCVTQCQCGSVRQVTECSSTSCVLWGFRMGSNPFFGKFKEDATKEDAST